MPTEAHLTYNGIKLGFIETQEVGEEAVYDESNTDQTGTKLRIRVVSIFNPDCTPRIEIDDGVVVRPETPAETMKRVRHMLLLPRRDLNFSPAGGEDFLVIGGTDDQNGPKPIACNVRRITPETWEIEYTVEVFVRDCAGDGTRDWLSLRWSDSITYNEQWFATRRRTGTLILSSSATPDADAAFMRPRITPAVPLGFRRVSAEYRLEPDNVTVRFTFIDKELRESPQEPAVKYSGRMSSATPNGALILGAIQLRVEGPNTVKKTELVQLAVGVAMRRLRQSRPLAEASGVIVAGSVSDSLNDDENVVEVALQWKIKPDTKRTLAEPGADPFAGAYGWVGAPLNPVNPNRAIGPPVYGTATAVKLAGALLNDPCGSDPGAVNDAVSNPGTPADTTLGGATLRYWSPYLASNLGPELPLVEDNGGLYADDGPGVYEHYTITAHYSEDNGTSMAASTKKDGEAKPLKYHAGILKLTVEWSAVKLGRPPTVPFREPADRNVIFLGGTDSIEGLGLAADSTTRRYTVSGVYHYAFRRMKDVDRRAPVPPFIAASLGIEAAAVLDIESNGIIFGEDGSQGAGGDWGPVDNSGIQPVFP